MERRINQTHLLKRIACGDEAAFEEFFKSHHQRLHEFAFSFIKVKEVADEIVMDVFLKVWQNRKHLMDINNIEVYLFVSVRNLAYSVLKKEKKMCFDDLEKVHVPMAKYVKTPETEIISEENLQIINAAIETLPPKCKMVFKLIREEGFSNKEAAKILNLSTKTVENQISIAVKKIAGVLHIDLTLKDYSSQIQLFLLTF